MKKFEFSWNRFFSAAMCGAMLLFAGCEEENGPEGNDGQFTIEVVGSTDDADFTITPPAGITQFYLSVTDMTQWNSTVEEEKDTFLNSLADNASYHLITEDMMTDGKYSGRIMPFISEIYSPLINGHTYMIMVAPVADDLTADSIEYKEYIHEGGEPAEPQVVYTIGETTANVTLGDATVTTSSFTVQITPDPGTSFMFARVPASDIAQYPSDEDKLAKIIESGVYYYSEKYNNPFESCSPDTEYYLFVYVFSTDTTVGKIVTKKVRTDSFSYSETVTMDVSVVNTGMKNVVVGISPDGGEITSFSYLLADTDADAAAIEEGLATRSNYDAITIYDFEFTENKQYTLELMDIFGVYTLYVVGFTTDGTPTHAVNVPIDATNTFKYKEQAAVTPVVTEVKYTLDKTLDDYLNPLPLDQMAQLNWSSLSDLESFESFVNIEIDPATNKPYSIWAKSPCFKLEWNDFGHNNIWVATSLQIESLASVPEVATKTIVTASLNTMGESSLYNAKNGYISLSESFIINSGYNAQNILELKSVKAVKLYIAYDDAEGNIYPYFTVDLNDYLKK